MFKDYYIMYNPLTFNMMDLMDNSGISPIHMISYLTNLDGFALSCDNYVDYLEFDLKKHRQGMMETFAIESYAALYIGNQISKLEPESKIIHSDDKRRTIREIIVREGKKPKAVFITAMSSNFPTAVTASIILNYGNVPVIIGGLHVSTSPDDVEIFVNKYCPCPELMGQVIGAGDSKVISEVLHDLDNSVLKPEYRGHNILENGVWMPRDNVDLLPNMKLSLLKRIPLFGSLLAKNIRIIPAAPFLGCPYSCSFCSISSLPRNQRKLAIRSKNDFLNELQAHQEKRDFASRFFFFLPDNLLFAGKDLEAILEGIIEIGLKINFAAQISIDVASNDRLLKKLRLAGATHFFIGLESLDIRNLEYIGKPILKDIRKSGLSVAQYYSEQIKKIQDYGISIHGSFIMGLPHDYFNSFEDNTAKDIAGFCIKNHIGLQASCFSALPGSKTFQEVQKSGTWLYGDQGTIQYLLALCLTDLTEMNMQPPAALDNSPLTVSYLSFESSREAGGTKSALKNATYMMTRSFAYPTARGRKSLKERFIDSIYSFASQLVVSLYKEHAEKIANSACGVRGAFERLHDLEKNAAKKTYFKKYVEIFAEGDKLFFGGRN